MTKAQIVRRFQDLLNRDSANFFTSTGQIAQGINFHIVNSIPDKTTKTYEKVISLEEAKEIWLLVLNDKEKESDYSALFDKEVSKLDLDLNADLFLCIYPGKQ